MLGNSVGSQRSPKSACAPGQTDLGLCCMQIESIMSLHCATDECRIDSDQTVWVAGCSEYSLVASDQSHFPFW